MDITTKTSSTMPLLPDYLVVETNVGPAYLHNGVWFRWHPGIKSGARVGMRDQASVTSWKFLPMDVAVDAYQCLTQSGPKSEKERVRQEVELVRAEEREMLARHSQAVVLSIIVSVVLSILAGFSLQAGLTSVGMGLWAAAGIAMCVTMLVYLQGPPGPGSFQHIDIEAARERRIRDV